MRSAATLPAVPATSARTATEPVRQVIVEGGWNVALWIDRRASVSNWTPDAVATFEPAGMITALLGSQFRNVTLPLAFVSVTFLPVVVKVWLVDNAKLYVKAGTVSVAGSGAVTSGRASTVSDSGPMVSAAGVSTIVAD